MLGHLGAISLKLPNFLTTSQDVTKGADHAKYIMTIRVKDDVEVIYIYVYIFIYILLQILIPT